MTYLSAVLGSPLAAADGTRVGRVHDLVARVSGDAPAVVVGLLVRHKSDDLFYPNDCLARLEAGGAALTPQCPPPSPYRRRENEVLAGRDIMDSQVIDLRVPRVVRVNDVLLERAGDGWRITGVDIGVRSLLRRLLPGRSHLHSAAAHTLRWAEVELIASEIPDGRVVPDHQRLARLHPADIARVADAVPSRQAAEIVASLDDELAADTMEEMIDEKQADVVEHLDPERAADILDHMAPDAAADVLAELEPKVVDDVLKRMVPTEAADVHALLTYPKDTAGGLMTTDVVIAPRGLPVAGAAEYLRPQLEKPDLVYYVYVVDDVQERRLAGVFSLRDLLLADPGQQIDQIMTAAPRQVGPDAHATNVAQLMSEYNLMALPVTDAEGRLLGVVSVDDAMETVLPADLRRRVPRVFS